MHETAHAAFTRPVYRSSTRRLREPFVQQMQEVFRLLELLVPNKGANPAGRGPSAETVKWAKEVLLRVLPRELLIGATVNAFEREIHVTWESDEKGKRVVVFFPEERQLKIYWELLENDTVVDHKLVNATEPSEVSARLRWFFQ
jgi:hypothetical protein